MIMCIVAIYYVQELERTYISCKTTVCGDPGSTGACDCRVFAIAIIVKWILVRQDGLGYIRAIIYGFLLVVEGSDIQCTLHTELLFDEM